MRQKTISPAQYLIQEEIVKERIYLIRGRKAMLDADLAVLYGVKTFRLNEAVKRNLRRFPDDFMFRLTESEKEEVIANCDHLKNLKFSSYLPFAFTEQGVAMLSSVLNSERAIQVNIQIMRAFAKIREMIQTNKELWKKIEEMEKKYDHQFKIIFDALRKLLEPPRETPKRR
ncbi:MAG: DNA-binding protein, partial [Omnitrophica bacterium RIFCSPHIGHO2_12_FULL_44_12]